MESWSFGTDLKLDFPSTPVLHYSSTLLLP